MLIAVLDPEAIKLALIIDWDDNARDVFSEMYYFSFVTLTTLGYGDVLPISRVARSFATLEAVIGQLYLAVVIASLVGIQINQRARGKQLFPDPYQAPKFLYQLEAFPKT